MFIDKISNQMSNLGQPLSILLLPTPYGLNYTKKTAIKIKLSDYQHLKY